MIKMIQALGVGKVEIIAKLQEASQRITTAGGLRYTAHEAVWMFPSPSTVRVPSYLRRLQHPGRPWANVNVVVPGGLVSNTVSDPGAVMLATRSLNK